MNRYEFQHRTNYNHVIINQILYIYTYYIRTYKKKIPNSEFDHRYASRIENNSKKWLACILGMQIYHSVCCETVWKLFTLLCYLRGCRVLIMILLAEINRFAKISVEKRSIWAKINSNGYWETDRDRNMHCSCKWNRNVHFQIARIEQFLNL